MKYNKPRQKPVRALLIMDGGPYDGFVDTVSCPKKMIVKHIVVYRDQSGHKLVTNDYDLKRNSHDYIYHLDNDRSNHEKLEFHFKFAGILP